MLHFEKISMEHREKLLPYLYENQVPSTERNFACLFVWGEHYNTEVCITEQNAFIRAKSMDEKEYGYYAPLGEDNFKEGLEALLEHNGTNQLSLFGLTTKQAESLKGIYGENVEIFENRDAYDYIYQASDLMGLVGKKYSAKRNHINKFLNTYGESWEYRDIDFSSSEDKRMVLDFQNKWKDGKDSEDADVFEDEYVVVEKLFRYADVLGMKGGLLFAESELVAFTLGAKTNDTVFDVLIEKADISYDGAYPMINNQFAKANFTDVSFVNREEDLGIEGLRKAKMSYYPVHIEEKLSATIKL